MEERAASISIEIDTLQVGAVYSIWGRDEATLHVDDKHKDGETEHVEAKLLLAADTANDEPGREVGRTYHALIRKGDNALAENNR